MFKVNLAPGVPLCFETLPELLSLQTVSNVDDVDVPMFQDRIVAVGERSCLTPDEMEEVNNRASHHTSL